MPTEPEPIQGKINDGQPWQSVCNDIGRAMFGTSWPGFSGALIWHVIENSWARRKEEGKRPDAVPAAISLKDLADTWCTTRQRIYDARRFLTDHNILIEVEGGYIFNKRADQWGLGHPGSKGFQPLLKPAMLAHAAAGVGAIARPAKAKKQAKPVTESRYSETESVTESRYERNGISLQPYQNSVTSVTESRYAPYIGSPASEDSKIEEEIENPAPPAAREDGGEAPQRITEGETLADRQDGIAELMADLAGLESCDKITRAQTAAAVRGYGIEWAEAAVMSAAAIRPTNPWQYVNRLLVSYRAENGPRVVASPDPTAKADDRPATIRLTPSQARHEELKRQALELHRLANLEQETQHA